jgi:hypothetical protein
VRKRSDKVFGTRSGPRTQGSRSTTVETREPLAAILIVCEGEKTEPNYFRAFGVTNHIYGDGLETIRVVEAAEEINEAKGPFDQIWCVFDRDSFPAHNFDNAIHKVQRRAGDGFHVAYTNEAFELWYLLHFEYQDAALNRSSYKERLSRHLSREYRKRDPDVYLLLQQLGNESVATRHAQRLRDHHGSATPCSTHNPETTVDLLVIELRKIQRLKQS